MASLQIYKTYSFRTKDPIIDEIREIVKRDKWTYTEISEKTRVSTQTLYNWFDGTTRRPQHATIKAVVRGLGYDYRLVKVNGSGK